MWCAPNYGANLTGLALQRKLTSMGYSNQLIFYTQGRPSEEEYEASPFCQFARNEMETTALFKDLVSLQSANDLFDTFIVGSDQVWRYAYTRDAQYSYFCAFAQPEKKLISMAASFGVSEWEWSEEERISLLAHISRFDAVSVRERDGVDLCKQYLGVEAEWVLDPVFFFDGAWWGELADKDTEKLPEHYIASYVLDMTKDINKQLRSDSSLPIIDASTRDGKKASVYAWLRTIRDCDSFITDSFHGVCFALIFRRPFVVFANRVRGYSRFSSILSLFDMEYRIVEPSDHHVWKPLLRESIEEAQYQSKLTPMLTKSEEFLQNSIIGDCKNNKMTYPIYLALELKKEINTINRKFYSLMLLKYKILSYLSWGKRKASYQQTYNHLIEKIKKM